MKCRGITLLKPAGTLPAALCVYPAVVAAQAPNHCSPESHQRLSTALKRVDASPAASGVLGMPLLCAARLAPGCPNPPSRPKANAACSSRTSLLPTATPPLTHPCRSLAPSAHPLAPAAYWLTRPRRRRRWRPGRGAGAPENGQGPRPLRKRRRALTPGLWGTRPALGPPMRPSCSLCFCAPATTRTRRRPYASARGRAAWAMAGQAREEEAPSGAPAAAFPRPRSLPSAPLNLTAVTALAGALRPRPPRRPQRSASGDPWAAARPAAAWVRPRW